MDHHTWDTWDDEGEADHLADHETTDGPDDHGQGDLSEPLALDADDVLGDHPGHSDDVDDWSADTHQNELTDDLSEPLALDADDVLGDHPGHSDTPGDDGALDTPIDPPVGADPDLLTDEPAWHDSGFPEPLTLDIVPEPVDGFPWTDPDTLGHPPDATTDPGTWLDTPAPANAADLADYAAVDLPPGQDPWAGLLDSDDPATAALARWWAPET